MASFEEQSLFGRYLFGQIYSYNAFDIERTLGIQNPEHIATYLENRRQKNEKLATQRKARWEQRRNVAVFEDDVTIAKGKPKADVTFITPLADLVEQATSRVGKTFRLDRGTDWTSEATGKSTGYKVASELAKAIRESGYKVMASSGKSDADIARLVVQEKLKALPVANTELANK